MDRFFLIRGVNTLAAHIFNTVISYCPVIFYNVYIVVLMVHDRVQFCGIVSPLIAFAKGLSGRIQWQRSISFDVHEHTRAFVSSRNTTSSTGFGESRCLFWIALIRGIFLSFYASPY